MTTFEIFAIVLPFVIVAIAGVGAWLNSRYVKREWAKADAREAASHHSKVVPGE